jgi:hypothetical protein
MAPGENSYVLQTNTNLSRIFNEAAGVLWHRVYEWCDGRRRGDFVRCIHDDECGSTEIMGPNDPVSDRQGPPTEAIFAIKPLKDLTDQLSWERNLIEAPALDPSVDVHCRWVGDAEGRVHKP